MAFITEWFKVIKDGSFIGAVTDQSFARYSSESGRVHICKAIDGQYLFLNDKYYRDDWMLPLDPSSYVEYEDAKVISISKKEYDILVDPDTDKSEPLNSKNLIDSEKEPFVPTPKEEDIATVEAVRERKIKELSAICEKIIENGFSLVLSDGASHHFSMSFEDQINLINLELALERHEDVIYHADGELAQYYSEEDARSIVSGAHMWSQYNRALFNSFKNWINNIDDIYTINAITYESDIPDEYCTVALQTLIENI